MPSKEQLEAIKQQFFLLATDIGLRPAARAMGLSEDRGRQWAHRAGLSFRGKIPPGRHAASPKVTALEVKQNLLSQVGDRTRLAIARSAMRAFEHTDTLPDDALLDMAIAVALEKHGKNAALAHQWNNQPGQTNVAVQVNLPTEEEKQERRAIHKQLDEITKFLNSDD